MGAFRALHLTVFVLAALVSGTAFAGGPSLVMDAQSGRVLHAERAREPWYPASITKLMTVYVALDLVRSGQFQMESLLTVSDTAATLPPSKMAFKPGTQIRLDNALKIIMVKSANDVAATIGENLGGSIDGFAALMNDRAARLGMTESHFANPHGLPDPRNRTSARDMAVLASALLSEFPQYDELFHIGAIQYGRRIMRNTNGLIGRYPGADGMKTGFICSAGFNVVASATRNGRRLITVVLGAPSANERTMKAAELFDLGFNAPTTILGGYTLATLPASPIASPPDMRAMICDRRGPVGEDSQTTVAEEGSTPNLFSSAGVMAFAGSRVPQRTTLGPRTAVQPEQVWVGLNPPSEEELAAEAAAEEAAEKARQAKAAAAKKKPAKTAAGAAKPKTADTDSAKIVEDEDAPPKPTKKGTRESIVLKPVSDQAKKVDVKKPALKSQSAVDAKLPPQLPAAAKKPAPAD
jgi:D-alanyl-D-alanine carboxypeptidase